MNRLPGKVAVITGAANGIGKAASRLFLDEGAAVLLVDHDAVALTATTKELGSDRAVAFAGDVSRPEANEAMIREAVQCFGGVDILIANAGIEGVVQPLVDMDVAAFDRVMAVNVRGVWLALKYAMPEMARRGGGSVVITSSVMGVGGGARISPYVTSKHAVIGLMRSAALEGAPSNIRVNTVNPSPVETRMMRSLEEGSAPGNAARAHEVNRRRIPMGRYAEAEDIARVMLFLSSSEAAFLTGGVYMADGGWSTS